MPTKCDGDPFVTGGVGYLRLLNAGYQTAVWTNFGNLASHAFWQFTDLRSLAFENGRGCGIRSVEFFVSFTAVLIFIDLTVPCNLDC